MRLFVSMLVLLVTLTASSKAAVSTPWGNIVFADPQPSINHPRKVIVSLSEREPAKVNEVISNIGNIQKFYGADNVQIAFVVYGPGLHALLKSDSTVRARIDGIIAIGVDVYACGATMDSLHKQAHDLIDGVKTVPNGLPYIIEAQAGGWLYVRP